MRSQAKPHQRFQLRNPEFPRRRSDDDDLPSVPPAEVPELPKNPEIETSPPDDEYIKPPKFPGTSPRPNFPVPPLPSPPTPPGIPLPPPGTPRPPPPNRLPPKLPPDADIIPPPTPLPPDVEPPPDMPSYVKAPPGS